MAQQLYNISTSKLFEIINSPSKTNMAIKPLEAGLHPAKPITTKRNRKMTILFVADNIGQGGKERRMLELIKSLSKDPGYKIVLVSLMDRGVGYPYMYDFPITIIESNKKGRFSLSPYHVIKGAIKKYNPEIVHSWGSMSSTYMLPILPFRKFKFINSCIADAPEHNLWFDKNFLRNKLNFLFSDVILANCLAGIRSYKAPIEKTYCIYNGIDMNRFKNLRDVQEIKKELGIEKFSFIAGMASAFHPRKDYETFAAAAINLVKQYPDMGFLMIGKGDTSSQIQAMIPEEAKANIFFPGKRTDIEDVMQVFDVGVLCTNGDVHGEGVSNSLIEYMSLKKPVVATEGGGTNEVLEDGRNGFLIKNKDREGLENKLVYLYQHPEERSVMGQRALKTIEEKFLLDRMTDEFIAVYKGEKLQNRLYK